MTVDCDLRAEERLNAATHAFGATLGAVGLVVMVIQVDSVGRSGSLPAVIVYRPLRPCRTCRRRRGRQGTARAQFSLGGLYVVGVGVPKDFVQAHLWFNLAATQEYEVAKTGRELVAKRLTPAQIDEAQKLAREWWARFNRRKGG